ncbi:MAG: hypothetical protein ACLSWI_04970 [Candidatus Gastranaerophilaceae bacterium]
MSNYDASIGPMVQSSPNSKTKKTGAAILGGLVGMTAYYLPVSKDVFVNQAFNVHKREVTGQINGLKQAAGELSNGTNLSTESKMLLNKLSVAENINDILDKSKVLEESITDSTSVKNLKSSFANGFAAFKKNASTMDNTASEAMKNIKWNGFKWGMGIGAAFCLALSFIFGRNNN